MYGVDNMRDIPLYSPRKPKTLLDSPRRAVLSSGKGTKEAKYMAESFLTLMADYDTASQFRMDEWYNALQNAGFKGTQTPGLDHHISLATFPVEEEEAAIALTKRVAAEFSPVDVHISHVGLFAGGRVLFAAPETNPALTALQRACSDDRPLVHGHPWTPHTTMLIDTPEQIIAALPKLMEKFEPIRARITRLHLCAFWPTREILRVELTGEK